MHFYETIKRVRCPVTNDTIPLTDIPALPAQCWVQLYSTILPWRWKRRPNPAISNSHANLHSLAHLASLPSSTCSSKRRDPAASTVESSSPSEEDDVGNIRFTWGHQQTCIVRISPSRNRLMGRRVELAALEINSRSAEPILNSACPTLSKAFPIDKTKTTAMHYYHTIRSAWSELVARVNHWLSHVLKIVGSIALLLQFQFFVDHILHAESWRIIDIVQSCRLKIML